MLEEQVPLSMESRNSQYSILPPLEQQALRQLAKQRKLNFNQLLQLPSLFKEQKIENRKDTIAIFRRRINPPQKTKIKEINSGKIFMNEFWSEKYQGKVLRESQIKRQMDTYTSLVKENVHKMLNSLDESIKNSFREIQMHIYVQDKVEDDEEDNDTLPINTNTDLSLIKNKSDSLTYINSPKNYIPQFKNKEKNLISSKLDIIIDQCDSLKLQKIQESNRKSLKKRLRSEPNIHSRNLIRVKSFNQLQ